MKVLALKADEGGCAFYRLTEPARVAGVDITVEDFLPGDVTVSRDGVATIHDLHVEADVVIFQRPLLRAFVEAIKFLQYKGVACVVDIDDDLSVIHPKNVAYRALHPKWSPSHNYVHFAEAASIADLVTVSTPALAQKYGKHGRVAVLRNLVPESVFDIEKTYDDTTRVGWTGTVQTHPVDLLEVSGHIGIPLREYGAEFNVVGPDTRVREDLRLPDEVPMHATGWLEGMDKYYSAISENIDIGIVPLEMSWFNQAKSYLKGLEMASLGVPFIASPTDEYKLLASWGGGEVARKGIDWQKKLKRLLTDRDLLLEASSSVRANVRHLTYENNAERWINAWKRALSNRVVP